jgi:hypothetical protein
MSRVVLHNPALAHMLQVCIIVQLKTHEHAINYMLYAWQSAEGDHICGSRSWHCRLH